MNPIIPLVFETLSVISGFEAPDRVLVEVAGYPRENFAFDNELVSVGEQTYDRFILVTNDWIESNGGSRRIMVTYTPDSIPIDVVDGGTWGMEGFIDSFYFTDFRNETLSGWFTISDAEPRIMEAPEGGYIIEFTDRITLMLLNQDTAESETYVLRDNQVTYLMNENGKFSLNSIRPKSDDIQHLTSWVRVYFEDGENADTPLSGPQLSQTLKKLFPIPGRVR